MSTTLEQVMAVERGFWESAGDPKFYEENMDEKAISVMGSMGFIPKEQAVKLTKDGEAFDDVKMRDVHLTELTPDCATLVYHGEGITRETHKRIRSSISSVYIKRDGSWKLGMTAHQPWEDAEPDEPS